MIAVRSYQKGHVFKHMPFLCGGKAMNDKSFLPMDEQIKLLESRGLLFQNKEFAKNSLLNYGYYEIINGYKDCFLTTNNGNEDHFNSGITFEHIFQLFTLDRNLRSHVMSALETFEINLRQALAYTVAENISDQDSEYLCRKNYVTGKKQYIKSAHKEAYPIDILLNTLKSITHSNSEPFKHYREDYHNIPPWIIVKKLNFGNLIWWYRLLKSPLKCIVTSRMTGIDATIIKQLQLFESGYSSLLSLYLDYRNTAAHGGRIYNHFSKQHELPYNSVIHPLLKISQADYRNGKGRSRLGTLARALQISSNPTPYNELQIGLSIYLKQYFKLFPEDKTFIYTQTELNEEYLIDVPFS